MNEYFIVANSFGAPFFGDTSMGFQRAKTPERALELFAKKYKHPCGLYAAVAYRSATDFHKNGTKPLASWLSKEAKDRVGERK